MYYMHCTEYRVLFLLLHLARDWWLNQNTSSTTHHLSIELCILPLSVKQTHLPVFCIVHRILRSPQSAPSDWPRAD